MTLRTAGPWSLILTLVLGCGGDSTPTELGSAGYGTSVLTPIGSRNIEALQVGDSVLAVSAFTVKGAGLQLQWSTAAVRFSSGTPAPPRGLSHYPIMVFITYGSAPARTIAVTMDQPFLLADGTLATAGELSPGKSTLVATDGTPVPIQMIVLKEYSGGIHHVATSTVLDRRVEGHLLLMNGVVVADYVLQLQWPLMRAAPPGPIL